MPRNGYVCLYNGQRVEVHADTTYEAQELARVEFQKKYPRRKVKGYDVTTVLAERGGETVTHTAVD